MPLASLTFLPDNATLLAYSLACFALFITPGPDMSFFLAKTIQGGRRAGIAAMAGASVGNLVHSLAAAFGLSALIAASSTAFTAVKVVGALYLLWMAFDAVRNGSALNIASGDGKALSLGKTFLQGLGVNLTNPKVILFYLTFLPQFVAASDPHAQGKLLFLGFYFVAFALPLAMGLILIAERFIETMRARPKIMRAIDFSFAGIFSIFAVQILLTKGQ